MNLTLYPQQQTQKFRRENNVKVFKTLWRKFMHLLKSNEKSCYNKKSKEKAPDVKIKQ